MGGRSLSLAVHWHSCLGDKLGVRPHLWGDGVASRDCRGYRVMLSGGVAWDRSLDAVNSCGGGPDWSRSYRSRLRGLWMWWPVTRHSRLVWHVRRHLREWSTRQRSRGGELSDPCQELWRRKVGREARKTSDWSSWSTRPRQRAAAAQVSTRGDVGFRTGHTDCRAGEGGNVRGEAAKLLR